MAAVLPTPQMYGPFPSVAEAVLCIVTGLVVALQTIRLLVYVNNELTTKSNAVKNKKSQYTKIDI